MVHKKLADSVGDSSMLLMCSFAAAATVHRHRHRAAKKAEVDDDRNHSRTFWRDLVLLGRKETY